MGIMLGNLSVEEIEKRIGFAFPDDIKKFMVDNNQSSASDVSKGKWHCFDLPFHIVCGDRETAQKIYDSVKDKSGEVKEALAFSITKESAR